MAAIRERDREQGPVRGDIVEDAIGVGLVLADGFDEYAASDRRALLREVDALRARVAELEAEINEEGHFG